VEVEAEKKAVGERKLLSRDRVTAPIENRPSFVKESDLVVTDGGLAGDQAELVEREVLPNPYRERERNHLEIEGAVVARWDLVESATVLGDDTSEHVQASSRALGIRLAVQKTRESETFFQWDEVRVPELEHRPAGMEIELIDRQILQTLLHAVIAGKETAADAVRHLAQSEVQTGRLEVS
jgi:hypothetical protein